MTQSVKTSSFVGAAAVLAVLAWFVVPSEREPAAFKDQGQAFFKTFSPLQVGSIEVTGYNAEQGQPRSFKVEFNGSRWIIPSAQNYAADVKDRLARMTALLADLKKGDLRSDRESDFEQYGVIDPRDENNTSTKGRGRRVTIKDLNGSTLADLIIGNSVENAAVQKSFSYVREPGSKRIYTSQLDASAISTRFADWVETDLLKIGSAQIKKITFDNYKLRMDRRGPQLVPGDVLTVDKGAESAWTLENMPKGFELEKEKLDTAQSTLSALTLVGVRRKPTGAMEAIKKFEDAVAKAQKTGEQPSDELMAQIQQHFVLMSRAGYQPVLSESGKVRILSNEGEIRVACDDGVVYTLRMGNLLMGDPDELAGAATTQPVSGGKAPTTQPGREHRYLFVTVDFDPSLLGPKPTPPTTRPTTNPTTHPAVASVTTQPTTMPVDPAVTEYENKLKDYDKKVADGKKRRDELAAKFDEWYYIVSADAYAKLKLDRGALLKAVPTTQPTTMPAEPTTRP